jgi:hypothetical protein
MPSPLQRPCRKRAAGGCSSGLPLCSLPPVSHAGMLLQACPRGLAPFCHNIFKTAHLPHPPPPPRVGALGPPATTPGKSCAARTPSGIWLNDSSKLVQSPWFNSPGSMFSPSLGNSIHVMPTPHPLHQTEFKPTAL